MSDADVRIGLLSFSDGRERVHRDLEPGIREHEKRITATLESIGVRAVAGREVIYRPRAAVREAKKMLGEDVAAVVFNIPVFAFPNLSLLAAGILQKPLAILSPGEAGLPGMGGMLAAGGAFEQIGIFQERIWGPLDDESVRGKLAVFVRACGARHRLRGQVYGQIGGRSIGMATGVSSSAAEWHKTFGVDIDHVDQSEILRRAKSVDDGERERMVGWLEDHLGAVEYAEGTKLTREDLKYQAACAAAVKCIVEDHQFDFVGVKCHYDMSEYYCTQCLSAAFMPARLDWDGPREAFTCACEADGDGAMTMQILKLITGKPPLFLDLRHYDRERGLWTLCNCGGQSLYYTKRSDDPAENLKAARLVPVIPKYGGVGAHVVYVGSPGPLTCARLMHDRQGMALMAFEAEAIEGQEAWLAESCPQWPHIFARTDATAEEILSELHANHIHAVEGDCMRELELFAKVAGIRFVSV
ncbi:MAG: L-fucose/L-arabinose isomerase family protein [Planctomycetota bacterium]|jgi:L-fucose isomerase